MYVSYKPATSAPQAQRRHSNYNHVRLFKIGAELGPQHKARSVTHAARFTYRHTRGRWHPSQCNSLGDLQTVASTIQQIEGWAPGTRSYRNQNPGNLRCANQAGMIGCDPQGFAIFPDYQTGLTAEENQIQLDANRGLSIQDFIAKYAPASDGNNPTSYAAQLAAASGLSVTDPLSAALGSDSYFPDPTALFDTSSVDFSDPTTLAVLVGLGLAAVWALS